MGEPAEPVRPRGLAGVFTRWLVLVPVLFLIAMAALSQWVGPSAVLQTGVVGVAAVLAVVAVTDLVDHRRQRLVLLVGGLVLAVPILVVLARPDLRRVLDDVRPPASTPQSTGVSASPGPIDLRGMRASEDQVRSRDLRSAVGGVSTGWPRPPRSAP